MCDNDRQHKSLLLSCTHSLCLNCLQIQMSHIETNHFTCPLCSSPTTLDYLENQLNLLTPSTRSCSNQTSVFHDKVTVSTGQLKMHANETVESPSLLLSSSTVLRGVVKCRVHVEEDATLFCFNCNDYCLCSQCLSVENNRHKDHDVKNVCEGMSQLKSVVKSLKEAIRRQITCLQGDEQSLIKKNRDT